VDWIHLAQEGFYEHGNEPSVKAGTFLVAE
jgi:hypothetical protein